jgi:outer membrane lipoprotein-sorting protein
MQFRLLSSRLCVVLWLLVGGWLLTACQSGMVPTSHLNQETISLDDLLKRLVFRQSGLTDLKSFVYTTIEKKDQKRSFRQALIVREADSLRIETLNVLGQPLGVYIFNGRNMEGHRSILYDPRRSRVLLGKEVREALVQTLGMDVNLGEYISVFYGNIPRLEFLKMTRGTLSKEGNVYWLTGVDPVDKSRMEIEIDAYTLFPIQFTRILKNRKTIRVKWQDYREVQGRDFPHQIIIEFPSQGERLTLVYNDPVINAGIADDIFQLSPASNNISVSQH